MPEKKLKVLGAHDPGLWSSSFGMFVKESGYNVKIISHDINYFDVDWFNLSKSELIDKLKKASATSASIPKTTYESIIKYLQSGGSIEFKIPSKELLMDYLNEGMSPIIYVSEKILFQKKKISLKVTLLL